MVSTVSNSLVQLLRGHILAKNWSQNELGRRTGVSPAYVSQMLNSKYVPNRNMILRIAAALDLSETDTDALLAAAAELKFKR